GRFFFFSSRRRHTRWPRDWSSDVCSSDLSSAGGRFSREVVMYRVRRSASPKHGMVGQRTGRRTSRSTWPSGDSRSTRWPSNIARSEEHTSELQSRGHLVCRLLLEKKKRKT